MKRPDGILRIGGVGTGRIFQWAHLNPYPRLWRKAWLVGFFDLDRSRAEQARGKYAETLKEYGDSHPEAAAAMDADLAELRVHQSLDDLLGQVDVIDVCTTTRGRMPSVMAALGRGVHSMAEKPMARTWIECDRALRAFAEGPQVFFQLNDDNVFDPKYRLLHDLVAQGVVGKVQSLSLARGSRLDSTSVLKSQASALENGGGALMDYGSHGLAGAWYVLGTHLRIVRVEAMKIAVRFPNRILEGDPCVVEVDDDAHIKVLLEDPETGAWTTIFLEATWCGAEIGLPEDKTGTPGGGYLRIEGDQGVLIASEKDKVRVRHWDGGERVYPLREYPGETISFNHEIETFIDCVRAGEPPEIGLAFGSEIIAAIGAAYLSAIRAQAVTLDEFKAFSRGYVERHGDGVHAEEAILADLLAPCRKGAAR
jgi:predicted dehydrogenase